MKEKLRLAQKMEGGVWPYFFEGQMYNMHRHDELEINLVTRGSASYLLGDRKYELQRDDLVWLFPGQEHVLLNQTPDYAMWILVFKPTLVERASTRAASCVLRHPNPEGDFCRRLTPSQATRLAVLFREVLDADTEPDRYNCGLAYALCLSWAAHCASAQPSHFSAIHPSVEKAALLLRDESQSLSSQILSQRVGLSNSRLSRLFKAQTGVSLTEFRNRRRIEKFLEIYGPGQSLNLHGAALEAGFGSYPQFHRIFKQVMGYSPARHRHLPQSNSDTMPTSQAQE